MRTPTPYFDKWRARLARDLKADGAKAELARWLANGDETKLARWKVAIAKVLNGGVVAGGEFLLAVDAWRAKRRAPQGPPRRQSVKPTYT